MVLPFIPYVPDQPTVPLSTLRGHVHLTMPTTKRSELQRLRHFLGQYLVLKSNNGFFNFNN